MDALNGTVGDAMPVIVGIIMLKRVGLPVVGGVVLAAVAIVALVFLLNSLQSPPQQLADSQGTSIASVSAATTNMAGSPAKGTQKPRGGTSQPVAGAAVPDPVRTVTRTVVRTEKKQVAGKEVTVRVTTTATAVVTGSAAADPGSTSAAAAAAPSSSSPAPGDTTSPAAASPAAASLAPAATPSPTPTADAGEPSPGGPCTQGRAEASINGEAFYCGWGSVWIPVPELNPIDTPPPCDAGVVGTRFDNGQYVCGEEGISTYLWVYAPAPTATPTSAS